MERGDNFTSTGDVVVLKGAEELMIQWYEVNVRSRLG